MKVKDSPDRFAEPIDSDVPAPSVVGGGPQLALQPAHCCCARRGGSATAKPTAVAVLADQRTGWLIVLVRRLAGSPNKKQVPHRRCRWAEMHRYGRGKESMMRCSKAQNKDEMM